MTLVILAAGMGSRFGGLKQIEPMGPNGEFIPFGQKGPNGEYGTYGPNGEFIPFGQKGPNGEYGTYGDQE